jgi:reversibly glycosylated polypeptide/UDP-arabinopyranose mutase
VPTIRPESWDTFIEAWQPLFDKHNVTLIKVEDGVNPNANNLSVKDIMGKDSDLIYNFNDGVRNLGFAYVAKLLPDIEVIGTLDDDLKPLGDPIQDHLDVLGGKTPVTWLSTASHFMRGFPYNIRREAEVVLSHGVWQGVKDWDAPTQLVLGNQSVEFYKGTIPKGIFYPMCGMNVAFTRKLLPYMYWAPMGFDGFDRFADIWCGIESKKVIDENGWAVVTGYSQVFHERASDVWKNLQKEAKGLSLNEHYGEDDYFKMYADKRRRWYNFCN